MACNQGLRAFGFFENAKTAEAAIEFAVGALLQNGHTMCNFGADCNKDGEKCGFVLNNMALTSLTLDEGGWDARVDGEGSCECLAEDL